VLSLNSELGRLEGATLFAGIILYTFFNYYTAKKESQKWASVGAGDGH